MQNQHFSSVYTRKDDVHITVKEQTPFPAMPTVTANSYMECSEC